MSRYALICVNYNAYLHLVGFLKSIAIAKNESKETDVTVFVVDNSTDFSNKCLLVEFINAGILKVRLISSSNVGYFPGAALALQKITESGEVFDFVSVSNVDLKVAPNLFKAIEALNIGKSVGALAPAIYSQKRKANLNPKIQIRPTRQSIVRTLRIFSIPPLFYLYVILSNFKFHLKAITPLSTGEAIYAPHGSFVIFTKMYFERGGDFNYPRFLFGEEIFVGETCRYLELEVKLALELVITDIDHGSTSLKSTKFISGEHVKSLRYILLNFFPNR